MAEKEEINQMMFVERIKQSLPKNFSPVNELSDLLEISTDSVYRRIRGETTFTFDEIIKICNRYKISFDSLCVSSRGSVNFSYKLMSSDAVSVREYISDMLAGIEKVSRFDKKEIIYAAEDIPVFHLFKFREFASFKMFYWMKSVLNVPELKEEKFDPSLVDESILNDGEKIVKLYSRIPCIEIWSERTTSSILKQIDYYNEAGLFKKKEDALQLCDVLSELLSDICRQAEKTSKADIAGHEGNFIMYNSDIELGNNCILVNAGGLKTVYLRHHTFNSMVSTNASFCDETQQWLEGIIKKSSLISGVAEKQRYQYFRREQNKAEALKNKIAAH